MSLDSSHDPDVPTGTAPNNFHTTFAPQELKIEFEKLKLKVNEARVIADDKHHLASHFRKELHREKKIAEILKTAIVDLQCHTKTLIADINHLRSREKKPAQARSQNPLPKAAKLPSNILATFHGLDEHMSNLSKCSTAALKENVAHNLLTERNLPNNNDFTYQNTDRDLTFREMEIEFGNLKLELAETKGTIEELRHLISRLKRELCIERKITEELKLVIDNLQYNITKLMAAMNQLLRKKESEKRTEIRANGKDVAEGKEKKSNKVMEEQNDFRVRSKQSTVNMSKHLKGSLQKGTLNGKDSNSKHSNMDYFIDGLKSTFQDKGNASQLGAKESKLKFGATKTWMSLHCAS